MDFDFEFSDDPYCQLCQDDIETNGPRRRDKDLCVRCDRLYQQVQRYCLSIAEYNAILRVQEHACALCGEVPPSWIDDADGPTFWNIDHDHGCCDSPRSCGKCVRGLLCRDCNILRVPHYERLPEVLRDSPLFNEYLNNPPARRPDAAVREVDYHVVHGADPLLAAFFDAL